MIKNHYYRCWNIRCPAYAGLGYDIRNSQSITTCPYCHQSLEEIGGEIPKGLLPIVGSIGGGLFGWAIGGPAGSLLGAIIGFTMGMVTEDSTRMVYKENQR
ncbi:hypothetical protein HY793_05230 [Candidatus Desantisbacteria bacterium]|nr:hypothetical protein [Candidatus Desantisbacteria bacterium]